MKRIRKIFLSGLFAIIPLVITFALLYWLISKADNILRIPITSLLGMYIPGLGMITLIIIIFLIGLLTSNVLGSWIMKKVDRLFSSLPLIKSVYSSILQIMQTFTNATGKSFSKVVTVSFPSPETKSIGFITNEEVTMKGTNMAAVFVPTTPNPSNGFLLLVPEDSYEVLDIPVDQALRMIVSMGTLLPDHLSVKRELTES
ncbi:MAG: DUF502 domain-containing protein [Spirochaetia bacterium]|nr:DUF502 domain-containing protein [Spirochaetia bacterium]